MIRIFILCIITTLCMWSHSFAGMDDSEEFNQCIKESGGNPVTMTKCFQMETSRLDKELNILYKKITQKLDKVLRENDDSTMDEIYFGAKKWFIDGQKDWEKYKESECNFALYTSNGVGGSLGYLIYSDRELYLVKRRVQDLRSYWKKLSKHDTTY